MNVKDTVNARYIDFQKDKATLESNRLLTPEEYNIQEKALFEKYGIDLSGKAALKYLDKTGKGGLSADDDELVKYLMTKSERADRRHKRAELWGDALRGIASEAVNLFGNILGGFMQVSPNNLAQAELAEKQALAAEENRKNMINPLLAAELMAAKLKKTSPGNGIPSGESQFAKQGMKIEYMNLFK